MIFQSRFVQIKEKIHIYSPLHVWTLTVIFSLWIFLLIFFYTWWLRGSYSVFLFNNASALTSMILIGCSFALSGLCYFWNFADRLIIYRKDLGLMGFYLALLHGASSFLFFKVDPSSQSELFAFVLGVSALMIFAMMAAISNRYLIHELGGKNWRRLLRVGYLAYFFALLHIGIKEWDEWMEWGNGLLLGKFTPIPPSLIVVVFGIGVFVLRLALSIDLQLKKKKVSVPAQARNFTPLPKHLVSRLA